MSTPTALPAAPNRIAVLERRLTRYALLAYAAFVSGYFLTTNAVDQYTFLLVFLLLPGVMLLPRLVRVVGGDAVLRLAALYLAYLLLSALWSRNAPVQDLAGQALLAGAILFFVALTALLRDAEPRWFDAVVAAAVVIAAANALLSMLLWDHLQQPAAARLVGLGTLREPNSAGAVYGFYGLLGVAWAGRMPSGALRAALLAGAFALLAFLLLTQSRAAIIACLVCLLLLVARNRTRRPVAHLLALLAALAVALYLAAGLGHESLLRGWTGAVRLEIWHDGIGQVAAAPLAGHGYLSGLAVYSESAGQHFSNWHNSYLAALRDGGVIGLALLLWLLGAALRRAGQVGRSSGDYGLLALLGFGLIYMLTSTDALITRPRELWVVLWFPLGLLAAERPAGRPRGERP